MGDDRPLRRYAEWVTTRRRWTVTVVFFCVWCSVYLFLVGKGMEDARRRLPESTAALREFEPAPIPDDENAAIVWREAWDAVVPWPGAKPEIRAWVNPDAGISSELKEAIESLGEASGDDERDLGPDPVSMDLRDVRVLPPSTVVVYAAFTRQTTSPKMYAIIPDDTGIEAEVNTSLKVNRLVTSLACIAGVRNSLPNFSALWGRRKL